MRYTTCQADWAPHSFQQQHPIKLKRACLLEFKTKTQQRPSNKETPLRAHRTVVLLLSKYPPSSLPNNSHPPIRYERSQPFRKAPPLRNPDIRLAQSREIVRHLQRIGRATRWGVVCRVRKGEWRRWQVARCSPVYQTAVRPSHEEEIVVGKKRSRVFLVREVFRQMDESLPQP